MKKRIVLCADDYGQALTISKGILNLIEQGRLSATTCLVNSPYWSEHAFWLLPHKDKVDIGLHFNLTEGSPLSEAFKAKYGSQLFPLSQLMLKTSLRLLDINALKSEWLAQIQAFKAALGFLPKFIDGHQHVHQFPIVRDAMLAVYAQELQPYGSYIRWVNEPIAALDPPELNFKRWCINNMGASAVKKQLIAAKIPHNAGFAGIYGFNNAYSLLFPQFLKKIPDKGLIMCHPALENGKDAIASARYDEYRYFISDQFLNDCKQAQVEILRFQRD